MASISSSPLPRKGSTKAIWTCDLERGCGPAVLPGVVATTMVQNGFLSGWVSWFVARYRGVVFLTTRPPIDGFSWENVFFPTRDSIAASEIGSS